MARNKCIIIINNTYVHIHARMNAHLSAKIRSWAHAHKCIHARTHSTHPYYHIHMMYFPHTHAYIYACVSGSSVSTYFRIFAYIRLVAGASRSNCGSTSFEMRLSNDGDGDATTICKEAHVLPPIPTKKKQFLNGWECAISDAVSHCARGYHLWHARCAASRNRPVAQPGELVCGRLYSPI